MEQIKLPNKEYQIIYADPPWLQYTWRGGHKPYETMTTEDICRMPVGSICSNGVLFLWIIWSHLEDAFAVMDNWGFTYKRVGFVWVKMDKSGKPILGMGQWTRNNSEVCLLGVRGRHPRRIDASISEIVLHPRMQHSRKPPIVRDKIVQLMGDLPRIELFARQKTSGWDVWGDEV